MNDRPVPVHPAVGPAFALVMARDFSKVLDSIEAQGLRLLGSEFGKPDGRELLKSVAQIRMAAGVRMRRLEASPIGDGEARGDGELSAAEAATLVGVSREMVCRAANSGAILGRRDGGGRWRLNRLSVEAYAERRAARVAS